MLELIETGKIVNTHGIHGDVKVLSWAQTPEDLLNINPFYIDGKPYRVEQARIHKGTVLVKFENVCTVEEAEALRNKILYADRRDFVLDDREFFIKDLIGLRVTDADTGKEYGTLREVLATGANDVYRIVDESGTERLVPAIADCILSTDIEGGVMTIRPLKGLFDL